MHSIHTCVSQGEWSIIGFICKFLDVLAYQPKRCPVVHGDGTEATVEEENKFGAKVREAFGRGEGEMKKDEHRKKQNLKF